MKGRKGLGSLSLAAFAALSLVSGAKLAWGDSETWAGGVSASWTDAGNWSPGTGFPTSTSDIATFNAASSNLAVDTVAGHTLNQITLGFLAPGVFTLVLIFAAFGWFYPARIIRGVVLSLREKEFVEAARMTGASDLRIMRSHLLPHLVAPIIVYSTLIVASNILGEAGLSFLSLGIQQPTASWGNLLAAAPDYYITQPWLMVWPGLCILLTTLAFNLLGDGLRDAFDPRARI